VPEAPTPQPPNRLSLMIIMILFSLFLALVLGEIGLRAMGFKPWAPWTLMETSVDNRHVAAMLAEKDPVRGWQNSPGSYTYSGYSPEVAEIVVNINDDGGRSTGIEKTPLNDTQDSIFFVGGSITMGYAISDDETMAWKVASRYPDSKVFNYGVPGYGTLQALQALEEHLPKDQTKKIIFYGLLEHHLNRNVLVATWITNFIGPGKGNLPPYAELDDNGNIVRKPPSTRMPWPLKDKLAMVQLAERSYIETAFKSRSKDKQEVFRQLMLEMVELGKANNAEVVVLFLKITDKGREYFRPLLDAEKISYAECTEAGNLVFQDEYRVTGEGHPNGEINTLFADCVSTYIEEQTSNGRL